MHRWGSVDGVKSVNPLLKQIICCKCWIGLYHLFEIIIDLFLHGILWPLYSTIGFYPHLRCMCILASHSWWNIIRLWVQVWLKTGEQVLTWVTSREIKRHAIHHAKHPVYMFLFPLKGLWLLLTSPVILLYTRCNKAYIRIDPVQENFANGITNNTRV